MMPKKRQPLNKISLPKIDKTDRFPIIDALRGFALLAMFAYHFSFDLNYFGLIRQNFYDDPFWIACRTFILSMFLLLVGVSLVLANRNGIRWREVWRRFAPIAGCAILVSAGSYFMFPKSWIYFGVLHHIAVASLLGLAFLRFDWMNLWLGLSLIVVGASLQFPLFDTPWLQWIGFMTRKPITEDYVPLIPWFGVVLTGMFLGRRFLSGSFTRMKTWRPANGAGRLISLAGQHSLILYMAHQPVFIGVLYLLFG